MGNFAGGSAFGMAQQIGDGIVLVNARTFQRMSAEELRQLGFELEKRLRGLRGEAPPTDDTRAVQDRQRRIQRLTGAVRMLQSHQTRRR